MTIYDGAAMHFSLVDQDGRALALDKDKGSPFLSLNWMGVETSMTRDEMASLHDLLGKAMERVDKLSSKAKAFTGALDEILSDG